MAYTGTIATEAEIALMAGENVDATGDTEANHNLLMDQVEAFLSALVQYDIVTNWASLSSPGKELFSEYASRYCALTLIAYNPAAFTSREEAETLINIHAWRMDMIEGILKSQDTQQFLGV